jgi:RNA ligase
LKLNLEQALKEIEGNRLFKSIRNGELVKLSYRYNSPKLFDTPVKRELRGITFNAKTGKVVSRPYHKFFNLNEHPESERERLLGREFVFREKLDGTMLHPLLVDGEVKLLTQKDFSNPQIEKGEELLRKSPKLLKATRELLEKGYTPIFELISPQFQLVIPYDREELLLTEVRENETGRYVLEEREEELKEMGFKLPRKEVGRLDELERKVQEAEGIEGFVLKEPAHKEPFPLFVKVKSPWYHKAHYSFTCLHNLPSHKLFNLFLIGKSDELFSNLTNRELKERRERELLKLVELFTFTLEEIEKSRALPLEKGVERIKKRVKERFGSFFKELSLDESYLKEALRLAKRKRSTEGFWKNKFYLLLKHGKIVP